MKENKKTKTKSNVNSNVNQIKECKVTLDRFAIVNYVINHPNSNNDISIDLLLNEFNNYKQTIKKRTSSRRKNTNDNKTIIKKQNDKTLMQCKVVLNRIDLSKYKLYNAKETSNFINTSTGSTNDYDDEKEEEESNDIIECSEYDTSDDDYEPNSSFSIQRSKHRQKVEKTSELKKSKEAKTPVKISKALFSSSQTNIKANEDIIIDDDDDDECDSNIRSKNKENNEDVIEKLKKKYNIKVCKIVLKRLNNNDLMKYSKKNDSCLNDKSKNRLLSNTINSNIEINKIDKNKNKNTTKAKKITNKREILTESSDDDDDDDDVTNENSATNTEYYSDSDTSSNYYELTNDENVDPIYL